MIHSNDTWTDNQRRGCAKDGAVQPKATVGGSMRWENKQKPVGKPDESYRAPTFSDPPSNGMNVHRDNKLSPNKDDWEERKLRKNKDVEKRCSNMKEDTHETWHLPTEQLCLLRLHGLPPQFS